MSTQFTLRTAAPVVRPGLAALARTARTAGGASPGATVQCCSVAADPNERRQAVGTTVEPPFYDAAALLDVGRGALTDSAVARWTTINDAGQVAGTGSSGITLYIGTRLVTLGFSTPPLPHGTVAAVCDLTGRFSRATAIDLADAANLLADVCDNPAPLPHDGRSQWIDRYVGRGPVHLARTGGLVASLDASGASGLDASGTRAALLLTPAGR